MRNGGDRHLLLEQLLGLFIEHCALVAIGHDLGILDQGVVLLVAPHGVVVAADCVADVAGFIGEGVAVPAVDVLAAVVLGVERALLLLDPRRAGAGSELWSIKFVKERRFK